MPAFMNQRDPNVVVACKLITDPDRLPHPSRNGSRPSPLDNADLRSNRSKIVRQQRPQPFTAAAASSPTPDRRMETKAIRCEPHDAGHKERKDQVADGPEPIACGAAAKVE
jgi:hypothetical protein